MYKYILFDFDGTIANSDPVVSEILRQLIEKTGMQGFSARDFRHRTGMPLIKKLKMLLFIKKVTPEFTKKYGEAVSQIKAYEGMLETLHEIAGEGYALAILSSNVSGNVEKWLSQNHIGLELPVLSSRGLFGKHKAIDAFKKKQGCAAQDILYVGDEIRDVIACGRSGVDIAFVTWGLDRDEDLSPYEIRYKISSPQKLLEVLAQPA